jgi:transposase
VPEFKAKVAPEATGEKMALAEKYGVHTTRISPWKRAAVGHMTPAFMRRGRYPDTPDTSDNDKLHPKIGQLVVERNFLADASVQLP